MSNRSVLALGLTAIAILVAVALLAVSLGTGQAPAAAARAPDERGERAERIGDATVEPGATPAAGTPAVPASVQAAPSGGAPEITPAVTNGPRSAAARIDWDRVPIATRVGQLGPDVSGRVLAGLRSARAQMDSCFADEARLLASGGGPRFDPADPPSGPGTLTLRLQSRPGGVDVVGTEVLTHGTSSAELVSCVRHVLEGWPIDAPKADGGRRYRLRYTVQ